MAPAQSSTDPRPARTRAAIFDAARVLNAEGGEVTVNALAKRAGVSRAAFYTHFRGLDELFDAMIEQVLRGNWSGARELGAGGASIPEVIRLSTTITAAYVVEHQDFLRGAIRWRSTHSPYIRLVETYAEQFLYAMTRLGDAVPAGVPMRQVSRMIAGGFVHVIVMWLMETAEDERQRTPQEQQEELTMILQSVLPRWMGGIEWPGGPEGGEGLSSAGPPSPRPGA